MTDRRPHWDTELEQSVSAILFDCYNNGVSEEQVYQVIAAVENWQMRQDIAGDWGTVAWSVRMYNHWVTAEATEARVRELHRPRRHSSGLLLCSANCDAAIGGQTDWPCPTIQALDGER